MIHLAKVRNNPIDNFRPFHIDCSCGVAGDFHTEPEARTWMQTRHFDRLGGISQCSFEEVKKPVAVVEPEKAAETEKPVVVSSLTPQQLEAKEKAERLVSNK